jgi:bifunctional UDP-N-acetylglucosamine pyrophosphorylase/glucosamine-1-phosphate N-acetyltransferase
VAVTIIVLAAGEGKRMKSRLPKVMHPLLGVTLLDLVLRAAEPLEPMETFVVVGHAADEVETHLQRIGSRAKPVLQVEQRGTGNAVRSAFEQYESQMSETVVVINGDTPLIRPESLRQLLDTHRRTGAAATVMTAVLEDPTGYGRVVRTDSGGVESIVEHRDATAEQRMIREVNAGVYAFDRDVLGPALNKFTTTNDQREELLTEVLVIMSTAGHPVEAVLLADAAEAQGCNDRVELAMLRQTLRDRINADWMREGVTIIDPATTWVDVTVRLGPDAVIEPNTHLRGSTVVAAGATIGPDTTLIDTAVGEGATVIRAHAVGADIGAQASVGPYAYLRPGTVLRERAKVGTFVEVKNSDVGAGAKVPHLSYVGDAEIGEGTNIGAATVMVNYDGQAKHRTVIGSHARTGADNMFVAPVEVGDGAYTAAGSVITKDVPPGALGVGRAEQRNVPGWVQRRRAGTKSAEAAAAALAAEETGAAGTGAEPADTEAGR